MVLAAAALLCAAAPAGAEPGGRADVTATLTSQAPGTPTGLGVRVVFHAPGDPGAKPPALRTAVFELPSGLRFDSTAIPQCTASDAELHAFGSAACPADTELTVGKLTAETGFGAPVDPLAGDDHVFNGPNQIIEVITAPGTPFSPGFDRLTISGSTLTAHPPATPGGPPDGQTAIRSIEFRIPVRAAGGKSLITTPPDCAADGAWTSTGRFGFADGSQDTVTATTPCTPSAAPTSPPRQRRARRHRPRRHRAARRVAR